MSVIELIRTKKSNPMVQQWMSVHYSQPKGFVGRQLIYLIKYEDTYYGATVGGSATRFLPGRADFFKTEIPLVNIVNNIFFHIEGPYPVRNFAQKVVKLWREQVIIDWPIQYKNDQVLGFETLVELPRTGELYKRDGWVQVGQTKGYTCKRVGGQSTDSWTGQRVWDTVNLRPKLVFCRKI